VGVPFAIDVEVKTERLGIEFIYPSNWFSAGGAFRCKDVVVAARGMYDYAGRIFAVSNVVTSTLDDCIGQARMVFDANFKPDDKHWIRLEVYPEGTTRAQIESGRVKPVAATTDFLFNKSEADLRAAGVVSKPSESIVDRVTTGVTGTAQGIESTVRNVAIIAGIGFGVYLTQPFWPTISAKINKAIS
jgi:hypothetical protein